MSVVIIGVVTLNLSLCWNLIKEVTCSHADHARPTCVLDLTPANLTKASSHQDLQLSIAVEHFCLNARISFCFSGPSWMFFPVLWF